MIRKAVSVCRQIIVITSITIVLIGLIEFGLRGIFTARGDSEPYKFHHKYIGQPNPGAVLEVKMSPINGGRPVVSTFNQWGFRGSNIDRDTDDIRIMVYGDSNIQAAFSDEEDSFAARLETELESRSGRRFQVINAGVAGYGPDQVMLKIEDQIPLWKPDFVVVQLFADNDFGDVVRNRLVSLDPDTDEIVVDGVPLTDTLVGYGLQLYIFKAIRSIWNKAMKATGLKRTRPDRVQLTELERLKQRLKTEPEAYFDRSLPRVIGDHYDLDIALDPGGEFSQLKIRLVQKILARMYRFVRDHHRIPVVFLIQPSVKDISTNAELNFQELARMSKNYKRDNLTKPLVATFQRLDADYLNLFPVFVTDGLSPHYFRLDDPHWNERGQELAASLMAGHILDRYELPPVQGD